MAWVAVATVACVPEDAVVERTVRGIAGGVLSTRPEVVFLIDSTPRGPRSSSRLCTGALVAETIVLTAKHCVLDENDLLAAPGSLRVLEGAGPDDWVAEHFVRSVHPSPGQFADIVNGGQDLALLVLGDPSRAGFLELSFDDPTDLVGMDVTAVGYGLTERGTSRTKLEVETQVARVFSADTKANAFAEVEPSICLGDSGGPLIDPDGRVRGVASFVFNPGGGGAPECGSASGVYNTIWQDRTFIENVFAQAEVCVSQPERCNGIDDDCDEEVDEGCVAFGAPCEASEQCRGVCEDLGNGPVCTTPCVPFLNGVECPLGFQCARTQACEGRCVPERPAGDRPLDATCVQDSECQSGLCVGTEDNGLTCQPPCLRGQLMCLGNEACRSLGGICGVCEELDRVQPPRAAGESCAETSECEDGRCANDRGIRYCAPTCSFDTECGSAFYCRSGQCIPGSRGSLGVRCINSEDCQGELECESSASRPFCSQECSEAEPCPTGFECMPSGARRLCQPEQALDGTPCTAAAECLSERCTDGAQGPVCTSACGPSRPCPPGLMCLATATGGEAACFEAAPTLATGCAVAPRGHPAPFPASWMMGLLVLLAWRRYSLVGR